MTTRREILFAIGAGALAPRAAFAQQGKVWRIGFLADNDRDVLAPRVEAFKAGMLALGRKEGIDRLHERSAECRRRCDTIAVDGG